MNRILALAALIILILPVVAGTNAIIENDWFGCTSQSEFRQLTHLKQEGDLKAFNQALSDAIKHMRATMFRFSEIVYIEDTANDLVLFRRPGEVRSFWTDKKAIREIPDLPTR
jgi:hypothetical protein